MDLAAKSALLQTTLRDLGSVLVAYSGGTDSAYLAYAAHEKLGEKMQAIIADSASLPRAELAAALAFTAAIKPLGFLYVTLDTEGYRSGSMNDVLPTSAITPAAR